MAGNKKYRNPSEYGKWHEITEIDTQEETPPLRKSHIPPLSKHNREMENDYAGTDPIQPEEKSTNMTEGTADKDQVRAIDEKATFDTDDDNLGGLDSVIKKLKKKSMQQDASKHRQEKSDLTLDDIGKSVLQGLSSDEFLDQLEKDLESTSDLLNNKKNGKKNSI